jgi:uncharacterized protein YjbI with pentapeptide repeats
MIDLARCQIVDTVTPDNYFRTKSHPRREETSMTTDTTSVDLDHEGLDEDELEDEKPPQLPPWEREYALTPNSSAAGLDLTGVEYSGGDFSGVDFREAILGWWDPVSDDDTYGPGGTPDLQFTTFEGTNLIGANFAGQDLSGVSFYEANLRGADLTNCSLAGCNLSYADLTGVNLTGVRGLEDANLEDTILDDVIGLTDEQRDFVGE